MNRSTIFSKAHKIAKANKYNSGTYAQRLSSALKATYLKARMLKAKKEASIKEQKERLQAWAIKEANRVKIDPIQAQHEYYQRHRPDSSVNSLTTWGY
jgi:hypothetical protein